jgi:hypothetical protein
MVDVRAASARQPGNPIKPANSAVAKRTGEKARTAGRHPKNDDPRFAKMMGAFIKSFCLAYIVLMSAR